MSDFIHPVTPVTSIRQLLSQPRFATFNRSQGYAVFEMIEIADQAGDGQSFRMPLETLLRCIGVGLKRWTNTLLPKLLAHEILSCEIETNEVSGLDWITLRLADWIRRIGGNTEQQQQHDSQTETRTSSVQTRGTITPSVLSEFADAARSQTNGNGRHKPSDDPQRVRERVQRFREKTEDVTPQGALQGGVTGGDSGALQGVTEIEPEIDAELAAFRAHIEHAFESNRDSNRIDRIEKEINISSIRIESRFDSNAREPVEEPVVLRQVEAATPDPHEPPANVVQDLVAQEILPARAQKLVREFGVVRCREVLSILPYLNAKKIGATIEFVLKHPEKYHSLVEYQAQEAMTLLAAEQGGQSSGQQEQPLPRRPPDNGERGYPQRVDRGEPFASPAPADVLAAARERTKRA